MACAGLKEAEENINITFKNRNSMDKAFIMALEMMKLTSKTKLSD